MALPTLTPEQRQEALKKAAAARSSASARSRATVDEEAPASGRPEPTKGATSLAQSC